jgi:hypothetical protein
MRFTCLFILLLFSISTSAQYKLKGYLGVQGGESFNYILDFKDSSGFISGYAYTFQNEKKDVKASIRGFIDREDQTITFRETELIYNHGFESYATICLIQSTLHFVEEDRNRVFTGAITSADITNVSCSNGTITITGLETVKDIFENRKPIGDTVIAAKKVIVAKPLKAMKIIYDTSLTQSPKSKTLITTEKITEGVDKMYTWHSDSLVMDIWDGGKIDGDKIDIYINNDLVLKGYIIKKEKKRISVPLTKKVNELTILAVNEGNESPNTADITLFDGNKLYSLLAYNISGKKAIIKLTQK